MVVEAAVLASVVAAALGVFRLKVKNQSGFQPVYV
jgi:hypothetical protein